MRMAKIILALLLAFVSVAANAASCSWVPYNVSGAVTGTTNAGQCKLTISAITGGGLQVGDTITVAGVAGATGCNGTTTVSAVDSSATIELAGTTFGGAYTSGGTVAGGRWTTTNTTNWSNTGGGSPGTCGATGGVPKQAADTANFDSHSSGGITLVDSSMNGTTLTGINAGALVGTLDFSLGNPSMTLTATVSAMVLSGTSTRSFNLGSGTFTFTPSGTVIGPPFSLATTTGLTSFNGGNATLTFNQGSSGFSGQQVSLGAQTYGTINVGSHTGGGSWQTLDAGWSATNFNVSAPNQVIIFSSSTAVTITNALNWSGSPASPIWLQANNSGNGVQAKLATPSSTITGVVSTYMNFSTGTNVCNNCLDGVRGQNSGITINPPGPGGNQSPLIGG